MVDSILRAEMIMIIAIPFIWQSTILNITLVIVQYHMYWCCLLFENNTYRRFCFCYIFINCCIRISLRISLCRFAEDTTLVRAKSGLSCVSYSLKTSWKSNIAGFYRCLCVCFLRSMASIQC